MIRSYVIIRGAMPNTKSAKKAVRSSARKKMNNLFWKKRVKDAAKNLKTSLSSKEVSADILKTQLSVLQKVIDKAAKERVFHKNNAARIKSKYAKKIAAHTSKAPKATAKPRAKSTAKKRA